MSGIIDSLNGILWGEGMLTLLIGAGIYFTIRCHFFQFAKISTILKHTVFTLFRKKPATDSTGKKSISQFQAVATSLAATMGTGNIAGVATALTLGGPGAIFWMWVSSLFGMIIVFCENTLSLYYRYKNKRGEWVGGPMVYLEKGLGLKWLGIIYAVFCILASFGMGNITQSNSISESLKVSFSVSPVVSGVILFVLSGVIILGGVKRIGSFAEKLIPILSVLYIIASIIIIVINRSALPQCFSDIFKSAFGLNQAVGGISGAIIKQTMSVGLRRGVFSNEAGLGSAGIVHSTSDNGNPVSHGMWGIVEVFLDTVICCTLTALVILTSGAMNFGNADGAELVIRAFETGFGKFSGAFVSVSIVLFAFATLLGWSVIGLKAFEYVFTERFSKYYKYIYLCVILIGSVSSVSAVWAVSDIFNGLMALPNIVGLIFLFPVVKNEIKKLKTK